MKMLWGKPRRSLSFSLSPPDGKQCNPSSRPATCLSQGLGSLLVPHVSWNSPSTWVPDSTTASESWAFQRPRQAKGIAQATSSTRAPATTDHKAAFWLQKSTQGRVGREATSEAGSSSSLKYLMACRTCHSFQTLGEPWPLCPTLFLEVVVVREAKKFPLCHPFQIDAGQTVKGARLCSPGMAWHQPPVPRFSSL